MRFILKSLTAMLLLMACNSTSPEVSDDNLVTVQATTSTPSGNSTLMDSLVHRALHDGDEMAYNEIASYYQLDKLNPELLYYALLVHNRYRNPEAAFHIFVALTDDGPGNLAQNLNQLDSSTKSMALYYLLTAYENGFESAGDQVEEIYADSARVASSARYANR